MYRKYAGYDRAHRSLIRKIRLALGLFLLLLIAFQFVIGVCIVRDDGMSPVCRSGRPVFFLRLSRDPGRSELVCLRLPDGSTAVRRVVATAGDSVEIRGGIAYINGLAERGSYGFTRTDPRGESVSYPLILDRGEVFVLGDAREIAVDSREFGVVSTRELLGRALLG